MKRPYDKQKETAGGFATIIFIISGLYFFVSDGGFASLFSLKALGFFVAGMFLAAIVIGIPGYFLERAVAKVLMKTVKDPFSVSAIRKIRGIGVVLMIVTVIITFVVTKVAYKWLIA